ncbi:ABC transporter ATP-binding protein [Nocardia sp. NPDC059240]|uniref:ABC transporter ATP-binding protein n=1 Tax=Nocardia sp. NPDC059240 TaxID=3346786 RepID=UPI0036CC4D53
MAQKDPALGDLLRPIRWRLRAAVLAQALGAAASVVPFIAIAELGRVLVGHGSDRAHEAWRWAVIAVVALLVRTVLLLAAGGITHFADNELQLDIRRRLVRRLREVPLAWFSDRNSGTVKKVVTDDVEAMHHLVAHSMLELTSAVVVPVISLGYLFWVDWAMTLVTIAPLVVGLGLYTVTMAAMGPRMPEYDRAMTEINGRAVEFVHGIGVVKIFGQTRRAHTRYLRAADDFATFFEGWVRSTLNSKTAAEVVLSPVAVLTAVLGGGAIFVNNGWLAAVDLLPFALLGVGLTAPVLALFYASYELRLAKTAAARVNETLAVEPLPVPAEPKVPQGHAVRFEDVRCSYDGEHDVLSGIDLELPQGTVTALVGPSGAGKSTLATLVPRFRDVTAGAVTIGGVDVREIASEELYRRVAFVFQDVRLIRDSIAANIAMARPGASREEIIEVARAAGVHDEIAALPRGYDSISGVDVQLSGGQAQRVSIARALLADTPIIVLDEAAAYVDPQSEAAVQDALSRLTVGKTVLMIAHRLSTVTRADQIVVLADGAIAERGRHHELLDAGGRYARMWAAYERTEERAGA